MISERSSCCGVQPRIDRNRVESATILGGSPALREVEVLGPSRFRRAAINHARWSPVHNPHCKPPTHDRQAAHRALPNVRSRDQRGECSLEFRCHQEWDNPFRRFKGRVQDKGVRGPKNCTGNLLGTGHGNALKKDADAVQCWALEE